MKAIKNILKIKLNKLQSKISKSTKKTIIKKKNITSMGPTAPINTNTIIRNRRRLIINMAQGATTNMNITIKRRSTLKKLKFIPNSANYHSKS